MTKLIPCGCKHDFQDKEYGAGMRVHNKGKGTVSTDKWICTVCGKSLSISSPKAEKKAIVAAKG